MRLVCAHTFPARLSSPSASRLSDFGEECLECSAWALIHPQATACWVKHRRLHTSTPVVDSKMADRKATRQGQMQ